MEDKFKLLASKIIMIHKVVGRKEKKVSLGAIGGSKAEKAENPYPRC